MKRYIAPTAALVEVEIVDILTTSYMEEEDVLITWGSSVQHFESNDLYSRMSKLV